MTLSNIWDAIADNPGWTTAIIILLLSLVEISKIKINPWSAIGRCVGKFLGIKNVSDKVDALETKVDKLEGKVDELDNKVEEKDAVTSRVRILRFSSEIMNHQWHNKDSWDQTMIDIDKYEKYVDAHPKFKNGITEPTIDYLKEQYRERLEKGDWEKKN
jgi:hypothetical protein